MNAVDRKHIERCLQLARKGQRRVSPNPMVGCVIVRNGNVVAEGYHQKFGGSHAEASALKRAGSKARGATLYVNLEPCSHHGKTPPCVDAIVAAGVKRVVASSKDPNPVVSGSGFRELKRAGVHVRVGELQREAEELNEKFFTFMKTGLPFVGVKVAQTLDGRIADAWGASKWITGEKARKHSHKLRTEYDAVLVGARTVLRDDPRLTVRWVKGRNPVRIVVDGKLSVRPSARVFRTNEARTLLLTSTQAMRKQPVKVQRLSRRGVEIIPVQNTFRLRPKEILTTLARLNISSVLMEGGSRTIAPFVEAALVQKIHCFVAPKVLGAGLNSLALNRPVSLSKSVRVTDLVVARVGIDLLIEGRIL